MASADLRFALHAPVCAFVAVARTGSTTLAAAELGRTQPAVSMAVRTLEEHLGHVLFHRTPQGVRLTEAGQRLYELAGPLVSAWESLPDRLDEALAGQPRGRLVVGAGEAVLLRWLPAVVKDFKRRHPDVSVVLRHQPRAQSLRDLHDGTVDLAVRSIDGPADGLQVRPLVSSPRVVVAPRGTGLPRRPTAAHLARHPFVLPREGSFTRRALEGLFEREGLALQVALESGGWGLLKAHVAARLGVAVLPEIVLSPADRRRFEVRPVAGLLGEDRFGLLDDPRRPASRASEAFAELCLAQAR